MYSEMFKPDEPIIRSLLDIDFYKFTMGQLIYLLYPSVNTTFKLTNRTKSVRLAEEVRIEQLREELDHARTLRLSFKKTGQHYSRGTNEYQEKMFCEDYLAFLSELRLPEYELEKRDGQFHLEFPGIWAENTYWEIIGLEIVSELRNRALLEKMTRAEREALFKTGRLRLEEKIKKLKERPDITFIEFGTRRRFSKAWQDYVIQRLKEELPSSQFLGTSNTYFAKKHWLSPMGTYAHERDQTLAGIMDDGTNDWMEKAILQSLNEWWNMYGPGLSIALSDTFGTDFFLRVMTPEQARNWKGIRQDSGDPFKIGEKIIAFYKKHKVNPREKVIVFSDGLDIDLIFRLFDRFSERIKCVFGWGTNLTNDLGLRTISLVVKAIRANGRGLVKLSDNLAKVIGAPEDIKRYKSACDYDSSAVFTECKY
ncbi:MAG: nicotinate phosphoribosyltransferase [Candidatus Niyogibacteria bacterium]|nr:nicotinate phosphoribosyltransferase [Candidatus Niyogibacteria bacterium]